MSIIDAQVVLDAAAGPHDTDGMTNRSALVTGGTSGIGLATARHLLQLGLGVTITGRDPDRLDLAVASLRDEGPDIHGAQADASDWDSMSHAVADHVHRFGGLDVAVANAGFTTVGDLLDGDPDQWAEMVATNVLGPALLVKAAGPHLIESRGLMVFLGSVAGRTHRAGSMYGPTKRAVAGLAESTRLQLTSAGVRVALIEPGITETPFWSDASTPAWALEPTAIAATISWLVNQPEGVDINDIVIRPVGQPL